MIASVEARDLSKCFKVMRRQRTTLRAVRALLRRDPLTRELWALRSLSFTIARGDKVALIGRNGSGKTTLLRLLAGIIQPSSGSLRLELEPLALFKFWIGQNAELPVIDNIYLFGAVCGMGRRELRPMIADILQAAGIVELGFAPLQDLSIGQRQRLALSIIFRAPADFLIFDETLAHLDQDFARECDAFFARLAGSSTTVILTSHDAAFLKRHCRRAIWLDEGRLRMEGPAGEVIDAYAGAG
jgi:ABC-type polysaccharide/polyol phosphate transport system ATPase subunit